MARKRIKAGRKVPLTFTARERTLLLDHTFAEPELTDTLAEARPVAAGYEVRYSLHDLEELMGHVAAEANHSKDRKLQKELDALHERLQRVMEAYDDGNWQTVL